MSHLGSEMQHSISPSTAANELLQGAGHLEVQQLEERKEVGFPGAVGADEHVEVREVEVATLSDGLVSLQRNLVQFQHGIIISELSDMAKPAPVKWRADFEERPAAKLRVVVHHRRPKRAGFGNLRLFVLLFLGGAFQ